MDWCQTSRGPGTFKAGVGLQKDPVYIKTISHIIKYSIASYISDKQKKNSILELHNSKKDTDDFIHTLVSDSENVETNKEALLAAEKKLENLDILTNNAILAQIEDHRKPNLLEYVLRKMKWFTQSYSKKKFASRLLERDKIDKIMENLLKNPNYDEETYEILNKRAQEMEEEELT